ncbi:hypothetical protein EDB87DRAFT_1253007 [Lactarius vividus]|nr:hypothetical protein EDB87DRAFT_1253007 [Lactarius vividus]
MFSFLFIICCRFVVIYCLVLFLLVTLSHLSRDENTSIFFTRRVAEHGLVGCPRIVALGPMVSTSSPQPDNDTKRQRLTLEKAKVVNLSKQLQIRLQYARLKVEHGWQRQSLNEVENLYFHHSSLKGKSKARSVSTVASPFSPSTTNGSSPKKTSVDSFPEPRQGPPPMVPVPSPPPAVVVSPPPTTTPPLAQGTGTPSPPDYSTPAVEGPSSRTQSTTPAHAPTSFPPSVLSAFSQNYTVSQRAATMDFSTLSPFVSPSPFATPSASLAAPSSFVAPAPFPPQQTLTYPPSPFAPPQPAAASITVAHFPPSVVVQPSGMSVPLSSFPALVQTQPRPQPPPSPAPAPAPAPTPSPPSKRTPARRPSTPVPPSANSTPSHAVLLFPSVQKNNFRHPHRTRAPQRCRWRGRVGHAEHDDGNDAAHLRLVLELARVRRHCRGRRWCRRVAQQGRCWGHARICCSNRCCCWYCRWRDQGVNGNGLVA